MNPAPLDKGDEHVDCTSYKRQFEYPPYDLQDQFHIVRYLIDSFCLRTVYCFFVFRGIVVAATSLAKINNLSSRVRSLYHRRSPASLE